MKVVSCWLLDESEEPSLPIKGSSAEDAEENVEPARASAAKVWWGQKDPIWPVPPSWPVPLAAASETSGQVDLTVPSPKAAVPEEREMSSQLPETQEGILAMYGVAPGGKAPRALAAKPSCVSVKSSGDEQELAEAFPIPKEQEVATEAFPIPKRTKDVAEAQPPSKRRSQLPLAQAEVDCVYKYSPSKEINKQFPMLVFAIFQI